MTRREGTRKAAAQRLMVVRKGAWETVSPRQVVLNCLVSSFLAQHRRLKGRTAPNPAHRKATECMCVADTEQCLHCAKMMSWQRSMLSITLKMVRATAIAIARSLVGLRELVLWLSPGSGWLPVAFATVNWWTSRAHPISWHITG